MILYFSTESLLSNTPNRYFPTNTGRLYIYIFSFFTYLVHRLSCQEGSWRIVDGNYCSPACSRHSMKEDNIDQFGESEDYQDVLTAVAVLNPCSVVFSSSAPLSPANFSQKNLSPSLLMQSAPSLATMTLKRTRGRSWTQMGKSSMPALPRHSLAHMFSQFLRLMLVTETWQWSGVSLSTLYASRDLVWPQGLLPSHVLPDWSSL